ncbi:MAG: sigma-70 family RNA polymerase sigma factor [Luteolibacter sp.]|uniref:sigma-70 family RNA polymerase sigma factor n=1 Tax=Luteolibacter sp. TaxID=1962973 RepID=UPI00326757AE
MASHPQDPQENLVALITRHQAALHAYILSLLPNQAKADDVLQETNLVLWRKAADYDQAKPFMPWACRIAWFQIKAARRDAARDRHVFDPELLDLLAAEDDSDLEATTALDHALHDCLEQLPEEKRDLILHRYHPDSSVNEMASSCNLSPGALSVQLHRIRQMLESCVEGKLSERPS